MQPKIIDSPYQERIYDFIGNDSKDGIINAVAGSGKTTTIINSLQHVKGNQDINFLAFNKSISDSLKERVKSGIDVSTFHSFGFTNLIRRFGKSRVKENKVKEILYENLKRFKVKKKDEKSFVYHLQHLVDFIRLNDCENDRTKIYDLIDKHCIMVIDDDIDKALEVLRISNNREEVDFVDMLYRPILEDIKVKKYDLVYVDESQDLSVIQQKLIDKMLKPKGRIIAVGDPFQSIYGFAGADYESFMNLRNRPNAFELPLSVSYRCSKAVIEKAREIVPHIESYSNAKEGIVRYGSYTEIKEGDWVLCRNTKPLFRLCLMLFKKRMKATIKGHDIGNDLLELLRKTDTNNLLICHTKLDAMLDKVYDMLKNYGVEEPEKTSYYNTFKEKIEIICGVIFPEVKTVNEAIALINVIFNEKDTTNRVTLSTIHRAKGFESDRVFVLRSDLMPNKFATQEWQKVQEKNLMYVCYTRAKSDLIFIDDLNE